MHLRFFFSFQTLPQITLHYIGQQWDSYGANHTVARNEVGASHAHTPKVLIDFSRPKLASEFTTSQLRSTIIGAQIANLYQFMGWDVVKLNYLGDWGKDLGLLAVGWGRFGSEESFERDPVGHVLEVYDQINELFKPERQASAQAREDKKDTSAIESQGLFAERDAYFKRMEDGDQEAITLWRRIRDISIESYVQAYARLNVKFNEFSGESQVRPESIEVVESSLREKGFYEELNGTWVIDYAKHGHKGLGVSVVRGLSGSTSYLLRDIAAVIDRYKRHEFDKMVYVVDQSQDTHFQKVFQALRFMGRDDLANKLEHVNFGKVGGMAPQAGKVQLLGDMVDQATSVIKAVLGTDDKIADIIANTDTTAAVLGATSLIAQDALNKRTSSYRSSYESLASFEPGTGLAIQVLHAKLGARIAAVGAEAVTLDKVDYTFLQEESETEVLRLLLQYPEVTMAAYKTSEPSLVMAYLLRLGDELAVLLDDDDDDDRGEGAGEEADDRKAAAGGADVGEPDEPDSEDKKTAEAIFFKHVQRVLANGMQLLGMSPLAE